MRLPVPGIKEACFTFGPLRDLSLERPPPLALGFLTLLNCSSHNVYADFTTSILLSGSAKSNSFHRLQPLPRLLSTQGYLLISFRKFDLVLSK